MHFVDLRYKGIRIKKSWAKLLYKIFGGLFLFPTIIYFVKVLFVDYEYSFLQIQSWEPASIGVLFLQSLSIGGVFLLICSLILIPLWDYIANLQRLCRMILYSQFYLVNNIETPNMLRSDKAKVTRDIAYFPSFYYRNCRKKGHVEITVKLDGSKFHRNGDYFGLTDVLQEIYALTVVDMEERNGFFRYSLLKNIKKYRMSIKEVIPQGYEIPLMKHISWDISKNPHALINGGTGGGKSYFLNILLRGFVYMKADLRICDPKNAALTDYKRIMPYVVTEKEAIMTLVEKTVADMNQRYIDIKNHKDYLPGQDFTHYSLPPIVLVIDEYVAFVDFLVKKDRDAFKSAISQIVLKGREAGVFVVLATQRPDAEFLSGNIRDQLGLRVTLGMMKADGYRMAFGATDQKLKNRGIRGRGYIHLDGFSFIQEFYSPLVPSKYDFIGELGLLLGVEPCACVPEVKQASTDSKAQPAPQGAYIERETIYEEVDT